MSWFREFVVADFGACECRSSGGDVVAIGRPSASTFLIWILGCGSWITVPRATSFPLLPLFPVLGDFFPVLSCGGTREKIVR